MTAELPYLLFELEVEFPHCFLSVPFNLFAPEKQTLRWKKRNTTMKPAEESLQVSYSKALRLPITNNCRAVRSHLFKLIITKEHTQQLSLQSQADQLIMQKDDATCSH